MNPNCLMHLTATDALVRNRTITPELLVDAAHACRCKACNEALERYALIALRRKFGATK